VGPTVGLDTAVVKKTILLLLHQESNPGRPARSEFDILTELPRIQNKSKISVTK
jgi:hypothetical protein